MEGCDFWKIQLLSIFVGSANSFHYTKQGRSQVIDGIDDAKELRNTRQACALLGNVHFYSSYFSWRTACLSFSHEL